MDLTASGGPSIEKDRDQDIECLKRHNHLQSIDAQSTSLARHVRPSPDCHRPCNEEIEVGSFYEIDHTQLPPRSPIQLKSIRVVLVTEKTELNISVRFPSILSLRTYFSEVSTHAIVRLDGKEEPALDEQFVMGIKLARKVLTRSIPFLELAKQKAVQSFWLLPPKETETSHSLVNQRSNDDDPALKGLCWSELKCAGSLHWGVRRRVTFIGRHREKYLHLSLSTEPKEEEQKAETTTRQTEEEQNEETTTRETEEEPKAMQTETKRKYRKRKNEGSSGDWKSKVATKRGINNQRMTQVSKDRWSAERYKRGEEKMLEIMKAKGAVSSKPMLRPELRQEARKYIGDTGLLDHLLKHMAGKVAPGGTERFRRRHNADGAMEYWLESADLVNIRREAGVTDPYWTPPPGWKPGDNPSQDPVCAREMKLLKEDMANIKRDVQKLLSEKQESMEANATKVIDETNETPRSSSNDSKLNRTQVNVIDEATDTPRTYRNNSKLESATLVAVQEMYKALIKRKAQLEQQFHQISNALNEMQEEIGKLTTTVVTEESASGEAAMTVAVAEEKKVTEMEQVKRGRGGGGGGGEQETTIASASVSVSATRAAAAVIAGEGKEEKIRRLRSGFRICKPQGTFLWPNMGGGSGSGTEAAAAAGGSNMLFPQSQVVVQVEDVLMVPTPPSASSATSAPRLCSPHPHPPAPPPLAPPPSYSHGGAAASPVRPLAERRAVTVTLSPVVMPEPTTCQQEDTNVTSLHLYQAELWFKLFKWQRFKSMNPQAKKKKVLANYSFLVDGLYGNGMRKKRDN
ncbi:PREDICTED: protein DYAD-like [Nelumbo nucifera]|uniref:Protein DYAD-like n=1 Tax=Nelumbo nucifera TaxID=4432 RepID=A0A1U8BFC8_NELNU|nr:PREDICTED: protein DYAD-like [Nelumbo nucifera]